MKFAELPITGYLDRLSARPGETVAAKVSVRTPGPCKARLVGTSSEATGIDIPFDGRPQQIIRGSWAEMPGPQLSDQRPYCWTALICPSADQNAPRTVLHHEGVSSALRIKADGAGVEVTLESERGRAILRAHGSIRARQWYRVWVSLDAQSRKWLAGFESVEQRADLRTHAVATGGTPEIKTPSAGVVRLAVRKPGTENDHFNGKIEDPAILSGFQMTWPEPLMALASLGARIEAAWDFSRGIDTQELASVGPKGSSGKVFNLPVRAVVGARWTGREQCWRHAPRDYAAIQFHEEHLQDCGWENDFTFAVPKDLPSGAYALKVSCDEGEDRLPLYVLPARTGPPAHIAFLAPTFTYQVQQGAVFSTRLQPLATMRSNARDFAADDQLLAWLERRGFELDVLTDEDLHDEGIALLAPYSVVLTGSHPQYHTAATLDAIAAYIRNGGRMMYLGGQGFYSRIARNSALIEVRGAATEEGEQYHAADGESGGPWRQNRRHPQQLVGVGFCAQDSETRRTYRRTPESYDPAHAWIFEGIEGEAIDVIAGPEIDCINPLLGTPPHAVVLARAGHADMVLFNTANGGAVFSVGSSLFCDSLTQSGSKLLENVLTRFARDV